jgi:hypothetical protein
MTETKFNTIAAITTVVVVIILGVLAFINPRDQPIEKEATNNSDYSVSYLFEKDGIKVYRFYDRGEYVYFTSEGNVTNTNTRYRK